jgi:hypothetical protein
LEIQRKNKSKRFDQARTEDKQPRLQARGRDIYNPVKFKLSHTVPCVPIEQNDSVNTSKHNKLNPNKCEKPIKVDAF